SRARRPGRSIRHSRGSALTTGPGRPGHPPRTATMKGTAMTAEQRDMVDQILRSAPFDLGGDAAAQRPVLEQMLTSQPLPADVRVTPGDLGSIPVLVTGIAGAEPRGTIFHIHGGGFALGSPAGAAGLASALARKTGMRAICAS